MSGRLEYVPLDKLVVSKCNVRQRVDEDSVRRLMLNIMRHGLLNPLTVRPEAGKLGIVCGRLRFEALKRLKEEHPKVFERLFSRGIPVIVRDLTDKDAVILSLSENLRQNTMSRDEIGAALERLQTEFGLSEEEITRELQVLAHEIQHAIKVWRALKKAGLVSAPPAKPGRPPRTRRKTVSRTSAAIIDSLAAHLAREGVITDEKAFAEKLVKMTEGLSTKEVALVVSRIRRDPTVASREPELQRIVEEVKKEERVERVVLLEVSLAKLVSDYAARRGITFDEAVNELLRKALSYEAA